MHGLPRDLVTILRTEAQAQRNPPIDYVVAGDGGRMVRKPDPDIAMAELLEEAAAALAAERAAREKAEADLAERAKIKRLERAPKEQVEIGWTLRVSMLYDVAKKVADDGWSSPAIEVVEIVMLEAERRILEGDQE